MAVRWTSLPEAYALDGKHRAGPKLASLPGAAQVLAGADTGTEPERALAFALRMAGIPFRREYKAVPGRRFRFDFMVMPDLLVEVQGGVWSVKNGDGVQGHNSGTGITRDCEKMCEGVAAGFRVLFVTPEQVKSGLALRWIESARACAKVPDDDTLESREPDRDQLG